MIVYRELSSLALDLGFSAKALYSVSNCTEKHYHKVQIPKANGEFRELLVPDAFLKSIQHSIVTKLLAYEELSPYATAYRYGTSTIANARNHRSQPVILKLDIRHFFNHITYPLVKEKVFPSERYSEKNRILLSILCVHTHTVPQGAPTSPAISNIIMRDFDNLVGQWCSSRSIVYTRYCDDMTFSGDFDVQETIRFATSELQKLGFYLNEKKTRVIRDGQRKSVTGIVVTEKLSVPVSYRRRVRQEIYYCRKYGVASHLKEKGIQVSEKTYLLRLLGRVNYVLSVEKSEEMLGYYEWLQSTLENYR